MKIIQSSDNKFIKQIKSLKQKKYRTQYNLFFDEGIKNIELSLKSNYKIKYAVIREDFDDELLNKIKEKISQKKGIFISPFLFWRNITTWI